MAVTATTKQKIFDQIKKVMSAHCPPLVIKKGSGQGFEVIGNIPAPYGYKKEIVPGMYFASTVIRKDSVAFYFFPIYGAPKEFQSLAPNTLKTLKGKTCFHFKKEEEVDEKELKAMFKKGIVFYRKQGWIK